VPFAGRSPFRALAITVPAASTQESHLPRLVQRSGVCRGWV